MATGRLSASLVSSPARITRNVSTLTAPTTLGAAASTDYVALCSASDGNLTNTLLHFDAADNTTVFTDSVGGRTFTRNSTAVVSTTQSKFGGSSLKTNSSNIQTTTSTDYGFGTGDFTVDFWLYYQGGNGYVFFWSIDSGSGNFYQYGLSNGGTAPILWNGTSAVITGSTNITSSQWQHHALVRSGSTITVYLNGTSIGSVTSAVDLGTTKPLYIGTNSTGIQATNGYIDEFRVSKTAVYTANFTPSSTAFSNPTIGTPTLPNAALVGGNQYTLKNIRAATVTPVTTSGQTIDGAAPAAIAVNGITRLVSDGSNWRTV